MSSERNNPCYCGSGKKYKKCHGKGAIKGAVGRIPSMVPRKPSEIMRIEKPFGRR